MNAVPFAITTMQVVTRCYRGVLRSVFIHTGTVLTGLPRAKLEHLPAYNAAPSHPRKRDSLSKGIKLSSSEDAPSTAGTFPNPGARLAPEVIVSVGKEILGLHFRFGLRTLHWS